jgi:hypothetical protein
MNPIPNELGSAQTTLLQLAERLNTLQRNAQHRGKLFVFINNSSSIIHIASHVLFKFVYKCFHPGRTKIIC